MPRSRSATSNPRSGQQLDLADQLRVALALGRADRVADAPLDLLAGDGRHELVAAHPDVAVDPPGGNCLAVLAQRPLPGERVLVVRVDERPVDVEDHRSRHRRALPVLRVANRRSGRVINAMANEFRATGRWRCA